MSDKGYIRFTRSILVLVLLVILAGGVVRTTQSGMGCPDWPTCFGYAIPPTQYAHVVFQPHQAYKKGRFIIHNDSLKYAKQTFTSSDVYDAADWQQYEKHNYAKFQVSQTWIEYLNRLVTGVLGLVLMAHVVLSFIKFYRTKRSIFWLSLLTLVLVAIEAWLGKVLVDSNLAVLNITLHMLPVLLIGIIPVIIIDKINGVPKVSDNLLKWLSTLGLALLLVQILLGTSVRAQVDDTAKFLNYGERNLWLSNLNGFFTMHKSFSWAVALCCVYLFWRSLQHAVLQRIGTCLLLLVLCTMALGFIMVNFHIPAAVQPAHLLLSSMLAIALFAYRLKLK